METGSIIRRGSVRAAFYVSYNELSFTIQYINHPKFFANFEDKVL